MREWPANAPSGSMQPQEIEKYLRQTIENSQVTLVGELELSTPTDYANINWSLLELADYLIEKPIIKSTLTNNLFGHWPFPATIAIWSVGHAQKATDGTELWALEGYTTAQKTKLAETFTKSITELGLDNFEAELADAQRHIMLARIHAMLPDFALQKYLGVIRRAVQYHRPPEIALAEILDAPDISKGIKKLFHAMPDLGLDLAKRSIETIQFGSELGLPSRITDYLLENRLSYAQSKRSSIAKLPVLYFNEQTFEIEIHGAGKWKITDEKGLDVDSSTAPQGKLYVSNEVVSKFILNDSTAGFMIFGSDFYKINGTILPINGGFIMWSSEVDVLNEDLVRDAWPLYCWEGWNYSYIENIKSLQIKLGSGAIKQLGSRGTIEIYETRVPSLIDTFGRPIYSQWPELAPGQVAHATDNDSGEQHTFDTTGGPILIGTGGAFDVTISAGLGKSKQFRGVCVPGLHTTGLESPLLSDEVRSVSLHFPADWTIVEPVASDNIATLQVSANIDVEILPHVIVKDANGDTHFIAVDLPLLTWSIEIDKEPLLGSTRLIAPLSKRKAIKALVIHNLMEYKPSLIISKMDSTESGRSLPPHPRGNDARFDLRFLADLAEDEEIEMKVSWNYQPLVLAALLKKQNTASTKKKYKSVSQQDLLDVVVKEGFFSEEDWQDYVKSAKSGAVQIKARARRFARQ